MKEAWGIVNEVTNQRSQRKNIELLLDSNVVSDPQEVANTFNIFFRNAPLEVISKISKPVEIKRPKAEYIPSSLFLSGINRCELTSIVKNKIKNKKSSGFDEISGCLIRQVIEPLSEVLTYIVNLSFEQGQFPEILKIIKVVPIFKKGDERLPENYRPVALIPIFSKIFEYCFFSRLEPFLKMNNVLTKYQFGFRQNSSTMTAVQNFYEKLVEHMEGCPAGLFATLAGHLIVSTTSCS